MGRVKTVDEYLDHASAWQSGLRRLRALLLESGLEETVKWGAPCYTLDGKNVVGLGAFKSYFGLWFFQGALMPDPKGVLFNAQEGKTKALRQWRLTDESLEAEAVTSYLKAAIDVHQRGDLITPERGRPVEVPPELTDALKQDPETKAAFEELYPGKQREYADHVAEAKRIDTKTRRIEKILPMIRAGVGLQDTYR
jgi:uncharacterized protein YdeI (YjbR/CyaY-like superfamily)